MCFGKAYGDERARCDRMIDAARSHRVKLGNFFLRTIGAFIRVAQSRALLSRVKSACPSLRRSEAFEWFNRPPAIPDRGCCENSSPVAVHVRLRCHRMKFY